MPNTAVPFVIINSSFPLAESLPLFFPKWFFIHHRGSGVFEGPLSLFGARFPRIRFPPPGTWRRCDPGWPSHHRPPDTYSGSNCSGRKKSFFPCQCFVRAKFQLSLRCHFRSNLFSLFIILLKAPIIVPLMIRKLFQRIIRPWGPQMRSHHTKFR